MNVLSFVFLLASDVVLYLSWMERAWKKKTKTIKKHTVEINLKNQESFLFICVYIIYYLNVQRRERKKGALRWNDSEKNELRWKRINGWERTRKMDIYKKGDKIASNLCGKMAAEHRRYTFQMVCIYIYGCTKRWGKKLMHTFKSKLSLPVQQAKRNFLILKHA